MRPQVRARRRACGSDCGVRGMRAAAFGVLYRQLVLDYRVLRPHRAVRPASRLPQHHALWSAELLWDEAAATREGVGGRGVLQHCARRDTRAAPNAQRSCSSRKLPKLQPSPVFPLAAYPL